MTRKTLAAPAALAVAMLVDPIMSSLESHGMAELYRAIENPLVVVLARSHDGCHRHRGLRSW